MTIKAACVAMLVLASPAMAEKYPTVEADNGAKFRIINNMRSTNNTVSTLVADDDNRVTRFAFDCDGGNFSIGQSQYVEWHHMAPKSVVAAIARIACGGHK